MRVCHLCSTTLNAHYYANLSKGLSAKGISLLLGTLSEKEPPVWLQEAAGARYFCLDAPSRCHYPYAVIRLARQLRSERIEILQTHHFDASVVGVLAACLARTPVTVVTRHYMDENWLIGTRFHVALDRWMARMADCVVVPSHAVRNHMISRERLNGDNIEVIYYGFDFEALCATDEDRRHVRAEFGFGSEFVIGCVGRFFKNKGHIYLLSALRDLAGEIPDIRLLLLGSGDRAAIEAMIRDQGLEDRVVFAGYRKDVPACMRAMDVVVLPSLSESFGQVLVEAMAVDTPVVATDVGGVPEIVINYETGILIPPADPTAITRAVLELYHNPELRQRVVAKGHRSVRERFAIDRTVSQLLDCYRRWVGRSFGGEKNPVATQL